MGQQIGELERPKRATPRAGGAAADDLRRASPLAMWGARGAVAAIAALVLCWHLGARYLWQDEAATAVLAERMLRYGKPLAYDGRNLITMDVYNDAVAEKIATTSPQEAVQFFVDRGDFKADTTWVGQPWGQFVAAGLSMAVFGKGTLAARLPFALCGIATVVVLFDFIARRFRDWPMAIVAVVLLLGNVFWVLHVRQCRYYGPSSLFLLLTFIAYVSFSEARRRSAVALVAAGWCLFQFDYGTFWPLMLVLALDALVIGAVPRIRAMLTFGTLGLSVAPWVWYYELFSRMKPRYAELNHNVLTTLFNFNHYQLPLVGLLLLVFVLWERSARRDVEPGRRIVILATLVCLAVLLWVPLVTPYPFYRYIMPTTPLACLVLAYMIVKLIDLAYSGQAAHDLRLAIALPAAALVAFTPLLSLPVSAAIPARYRSLRRLDTPWRSELEALYLDVVKDGPDPNRDVIALLAPRIKPDDEVLVNYEDVPFMFYTDAKVRGGMCGFRTEDRDDAHLRFVVVRPNLRVGHEAIRREVKRHLWRQVPNEVPAYPWGSIPDPLHHRFQERDASPNVVILEAARPEEGGRVFEIP